MTDEATNTHGRRTAFLLGLAAIAAAGGAAWYLWKTSHVVADRAASFYAVESPLSLVPGQQERRFPTELTDKLERLDPAVDGWDTEVMSAAIGEQLRALEALLARPGAIDEAALVPIADPHYSGAALRPATLRAALETVAATVRRGAGGSSGGTFTGPEGFARSLVELMRPYRADEGARIELRLVHITPEAGDIATEVGFQASGSSDAGRMQQNALWRMRWTRPAGERPPRLRGIDATDYDETVGPADGRPLFTDLTTSVLGGDPSFEAQIVPGQVPWSGVLDVSFGEQMLGHHGLAIGDVNGDGLDDLYVPQPGGLPNRLYVQQPDGTAIDLAAEAGVDYLDPTVSALIVDLDGDGDQDLVTAAGPLVFHSSDGRGRFKIETVVPTSTLYSLAAADYDLDGDLDLYACKYGSPSKYPPTPYQDADNGPPNLMLRNDGRWLFTDVTRESGLDENNQRFSLAAAWGDYDEDGDPDLYVANDFGRNNLYRNDGGHFTDVAAEAGVEDISAGMSVSWGDYNRDGHLDLFVGSAWSSAGNRTTYQRRFKQGADAVVVSQFRRHARGNSLFENSGDGRFRDVSVEAGVTMGRWARGSRFADLDNDGWEDILVANGNVTNDDPRDLGSFYWRQVVSQSPDDASNNASKSYIEGWAALYELIRSGKSWSGHERHNCFLNTRDGRFADVSAMAGIDFPDDGRGLAVVDWDLDGALDFWISNRSGAQLRFLRNRNASGNHYAAVLLEGRGANRDAIGARVELARGSEPPLVRTLAAGDAYLAQSSKWIHFGLGNDTAIDRVEVLWPAGEREEFTGVEADGRFRLVAGRGRAERFSPPRRALDLPPPRALGAPPQAAARTYLAARLPLHGLDFTDAEHGRRPIATDGEHPLLVTLWASGCEQCRQELSELQQAASRVRASGLQILALSVDDEPGRQAAREFLDSIGWSSASGYAAEELLDVLNVIRESLVEIPGGMALPTSFLIDPRGELAALYRGPVPLDTLVSDAGTMDLGPEGRRDRAVPFAGRWLVPAPAARSTEGLADLLRSRGHDGIASGYVGGLELPARTAEWAEARRVEALEYLGRSLAAEGRYTEALTKYRAALDIDPMRASLHHAMGMALVKLRRFDGGIRHLEDAIRLDPRKGEPHLDLGEVLGQLGQIDDGITEFRRAADLAPEGGDTHCRSLFNIGVALDALGHSDEAVDYVTRVLEMQPGSFDALRFLGDYRQKRNDLNAAISYYGRALAQQPDEPWTLYHLGIAHLDIGDEAAARRQYEALQRVDPARAETLRRRIAGAGS